ncbi:unnamed protein product [Enterobius vermicularis]|uniref:Protein kinase domain-containing protein n=1 Tax=Enterobius vermicularis TaxID=51028 RepID=A0A3P6HTZ5_ENTVE|nr:unnamed protein product [Enterobius vermicularis]
MTSKRINFIYSFFQPFIETGFLRTKKVAAAIVCLIIFITLICLIIWVFYRYYKKVMWLGCITPKWIILFYSNNRLTGNFGVVYKGIYCGKNGTSAVVACKTIDSFLREGLMMANFDHPHVTRLIGISLASNGCPMIVTDYLAKGDLRHYIINPNNVSAGIPLRKINERIYVFIADGMAYLHEKKFIHRDLAARNCMLDEKLNVKISDFGLSRDVSRGGMYEAKNRNRGIPIRWMPIESLEEQQYTFKGDVWAYGVVLWELATRGLIPYGDLEMKDILRLLKQGHRLSKPKKCPDILYQKVMLLCWLEVPERRPTFNELKEMMEDVVDQLKKGISGTSLLNNHYERVCNRSAATTPVSYPKPFPVGCWGGYGEGCLETSIRVDL